MATTKNATVIFRIGQVVKKSLCTAATHEHRSVANMMEMMSLDYCEQHGNSVLIRDSARCGTDKKV